MRVDVTRGLVTEGERKCCNGPKDGGNDEGVGGVWESTL